MNAHAACVDAEVSRGCSLVHASPVIIIVYILLAICETSMFFLLCLMGPFDQGYSNRHYDGNKSDSTP